MLGDMANPVLQHRAHPLGESEGLIDPVWAKTSNHVTKASAVMRTLSGISDLLKEFRKGAEQFAQDQRWRLLLRLIFKKFYDKMGPKVRMPGLA